MSSGAKELRDKLSSCIKESFEPYGEQYSLTHHGSDFGYSIEKSDIKTRKTVLMRILVSDMNYNNSLRYTTIRISYYDKVNNGMNDGRDKFFNRFTLNDSKQFLFDTESGGLVFSKDCSEADYYELFNDIAHNVKIRKVIKRSLISISVIAYIFLLRVLISILRWIGYFATGRLQHKEVLDAIFDDRGSENYDDSANKDNKLSFYGHSISLWNAVSYSVLVLIIISYIHVTGRTEAILAILPLRNTIVFSMLILVTGVIYTRLVPAWLDILIPKFRNRILKYKIRGINIKL